MRRSAWVVVAGFAATLLAGAALVAARTASEWAQLRGGASHLVVYLRAGTDEPRSHALAEELAALGGVARVEYVAPAEALRRLRSALGNDQALLDGIEPSTMPASIEASLEPGVEQVIPLSPTISSLRRHPAVEDVVLEQAQPDHLASVMGELAPWTSSAWMLAAGLAALLGFAVTRLAWTLPRRELAVARLLGAGPGFHLLPVAGAAAIAAATGALAGVAALLWGSLGITETLATSSVHAASSPSGAGRLAVAMLGSADAAALVLAAALVAALAGALATTAQDSQDSGRG